MARLEEGAIDDIEMSNQSLLKSFFGYLRSETELRADKYINKQQLFNYYYYYSFLKMGFRVAEREIWRGELFFYSVGRWCCPFASNGLDMFL